MCLIDFQRKAGMENCKKFVYNEKSISGKIAPPSTATADEPVGCAAIDDTVGRWSWHGTTGTCRARTCTPDDHGGRHPDLLSLLCPQGDCPICATHPLKCPRAHASCDCMNISSQTHLRLKSRVRLYKRQFERFVGAFCLTNAHAMTVVGRPNMCGVLV